MISPGLIFQAALLALGVYWVVQMLGRWRDHLDVLRTSDDGMMRAVVVGLWAVTAVIAVLVVCFVVSLGARIIEAVCELI